MSKPIAFKVRTQGHYTGVNGGKIKTGGGGAGALWYEDKTFTIAATQDQWLCTDLIQNKYQFEKFPMQQNKNPIKYLSVCSGMEAATVAWHHMGWQPVGFSEIEPFPSAILKHHYPTIPNYGDLTKYKQWPIEPGAIDLLVGGTPCQSFSVAGLRKGLTDPRGNLALTFLGLADHVKPKWIIWENVPGVLSSSGGRDFGSFLGALVELGYGFAYRVLDAQFVGGSRAVPQRRRRVFVVACLGDWRAAAEVLSLAEGVSGYLKTGNKKRKSTTADAGASAEASGLQRTVGTLCADTHPGAYSGQDAYTGRLVPTVLDRAAFNQGQNAQYEPLIEQTETCPTIVSRGPHAVQMPFRKSKRATSTTDNETWVEGDVSNTLNNFDLGDTRTTHAVVNPIAIQGTIIGRSENAGPQGSGATENGPMYTLTKSDVHGVLYENHPNDSRVTGPLDVAPTVVSRFGTGGGNIPFVNEEPKIIKASELRLTGKITEQDTCPTLTAGAKQGDSEPLAITFQVGNLLRAAGADPSTEATTTLKASSGDQTPCVAYQQGVDVYNGAITGDVAATLTTNSGGTNQSGPKAITNMAVRRLTPNECLRLQGFPDNYSRIPWKGKPAEQCPDGPQYKACGNSMAVNVMRFIGEQINKFENRNG